MVNKRHKYLAMQVGVIVILMPVFLYWITWIDSEPISNISRVNDSHLQIPADAKSFFINHGNVHFSARRPISGEPTPALFIIISVFLLASWMFLIWNYMKNIRDPNAYPWWKLKL